MRMSLRNVESATDYVLVPIGIGADAVLCGRGLRLTERPWPGWNALPCCLPGIGAWKQYPKLWPASFMEQRPWRRWGMRFGHNKARDDEKPQFFHCLVLARRERSNTL